MKKLKLILAVTLFAVLIATAVLAEEAQFDLPEKVEIVFNVGDDVLIINGEEVATETAPYVVETSTGGVTLVPVRVITEAFGATVEWEESTRTVTLSYPDVEILLCIGNPIAEVNGEAVTLLTAPELPGGRTMVPLRFISETFGATVGYDDATGGITVTMDNTESDGETLVGQAENMYVGDSKYNWMMLNPKGMELTSRYSSGMSTSFEDEFGNEVDISVAENNDYDIEERFKSIKKSLASSSTLSKAEKNTDDPELMTMHFVNRNKSYFMERWIYVTDEYVYTVNVYVDIEAPEKRTEFTELGESFRIGFEGDVHDLVVKQTEEDLVFENEDMGIKLVLPEGFGNKPSGSGVSQYSFYDSTDSKTKIHIEIVSKSESVYTPKEFLEYLKAGILEGADSEIYKSSEITEESFGDIKAFSWNTSITGTKDGHLDNVGKRIAFDLGEYTYRITMTVSASDEKADEKIKEFFASMSFKEIDSEKAGLILDNYEEEEEQTYELTIGKDIFTVPSEFVKSGSGTYYTLNDEFGRFSLSIVREVPPVGYSAKNILAQNRLSLDNSGYTSSTIDYTISDISEISIGEYKVYTYDALKSTTSKTYNNIYRYCVEKDGYVYTFGLTTNEIYKDFAGKCAEEIIGTLKNAQPDEN